MDGSDTDAEWDSLLNLGSHHARKLGMRPHDVEECADKFRLHLFCKHPELFAPGAMPPSPAWLHTCARNFALNYRRQMVHRCEHCVFLDDLKHGDLKAQWACCSIAQDPLDIVMKHESRQSVRHAILQLPPTQIRMVQGYYCEEASVEELAQREGISTTAVHLRLNRARYHLRRLLQSAELSGGASAKHNNAGKVSVESVGAYGEQRRGGKKVKGPRKFQA